MAQLYRIVAPHFVSGIIVDGDTVIAVAPIVKYMRDWKIDKVFAYCQRKKWAIERVENGKIKIVWT
jgi:hypothetical protein